MSGIGGVPGLARGDNGWFPSSVLSSYLEVVARWVNALRNMLVLQCGVLFSSSVTYFKCIFHVIWLIILYFRFGMEVLAVLLVQILFDCVFVPCVSPSQACAVRLRAEGGDVVAVVVAPGVDRLALEGVHRATCQVPGR